MGSDIPSQNISGIIHGIASSGEDLWADIQEIRKLDKQDREEHYMGYLVLQRSDIDQYKIIDGQQRMTTLSLLILAALQILQKSTTRMTKNASNY